MTLLPAVKAAIPPVRLRLSRAKGFSLQAWSRETNGLDAVKVDRTTKWGNPFVPGKEIPFIPGRKVQDRRHAVCLYRGFAPTMEKLVAAALAELRGKNLACWCDRPDPYEDVCHAAVLIEIANEKGQP
jgi:hypothetical protein